MPWGPRGPRHLDWPRPRWDLSQSSYELTEVLVDNASRQSQSSLCQSPSQLLPETDHEHSWGLTAAYRQNLSKADGISTVTHQDLSHVENQDLWSCCSWAFVTTFHTVIPQKLVTKQTEPLQCVWSRTSKNTNNTAVVGLISHRDETAYRQGV